jgi:hypothetical protein
MTGALITISAGWPEVDTRRAAAHRDGEVGSIRREECVRMLGKTVRWLRPMDGHLLAQFDGHRCQS